MNSVRFVEVKDTLPFKDIDRVVLDYSGFGMVQPNEAGRNPTLIREMVQESDFPRLSKQFFALAQYCIAVAHSSPFIAADRRLFLAVEHVEGARLDHWAEAEPQQVVNPVVFRLATNLSDYFSEQLASGDDVLWDIVSPFQYRVSNNTPVLVDLDTSPGGVKIKNRDYILGSFLVDIGVEYSRLLTPDSAAQLNNVLDKKFQDIAGQSLFVDNSPSMGLDTKRYDCFI